LSIIYVDVEKIKKAIREEGRKPWRYLPKDQSVTVEFASGTPAGTEKYSSDVTPPEGYCFAIRYFRLITPQEVEANILVTGMDGEETKLLSENQSPSSNVLYDASDWDADFLFVKKFRVYAKATTDTTDVRTVTVKYSGGLVKVT